MRLIQVLGCVLAIAAASVLTVIPDAHAAASNPPPAGTSGDALANIQRDGLLRVGVTADPPFVMRDANGEWIGLEIDYVRQLAQDMGWKLQLVPTTWANAIPDLRNGHFDLLAAGLSVTPQRALLLKFSQGYGQFSLGLVVNRRALGKENLQQLEVGSKHSIGVLSGTVTEATTHAWLGNSRIVQITDMSGALRDLRQGRLDGLLAEQPLPEAAARSYPTELRTLDTRDFGKTEHALAVRRDDQALLDVVNAWFVYESARGFIADREAFWLHSPDWIGLM
jgi:polar amino acid transport system substrate-binding protein